MSPAPFVDLKQDVLDDATEELKKPEPDKNEVGQALDCVLNYAQKANGFAIDQLRPHVQNTAFWLGRNWYKLLSLVDLTVQGELK